jgi:hypothetical protein
MAQAEHEFEMEIWCTHCGKETSHLCRPSGHERDSSQDYEECLECRWYGYGIDGYKKQPPLNFED